MAVIQFFGSQAPLKSNFIFLLQLINTYLIEITPKSAAIINIEAFPWEWEDEIVELTLEDGIVQLKFNDHHVYKSLPEYGFKLFHVTDRNASLDLLDPLRHDVIPHLKEQKVAKEFSI